MMPINQLPYQNKKPFIPPCIGVLIFKNWVIMYDIKILRDTDINVQKTLNQWKHEFKIKIKECIPLDNNQTYCLVARIKETDTNS